MKTTYFALVHAAKEGGFYCAFPDFGNTGTQGDTINELLEMAEDFAVNELESCRLEGKPAPTPSTWDQALAKAAPEDGAPAFVMPVTVYPNPATIRISMTGPEDKLQLFKDFANKCGKTRSALMVEATMEYIMRAEKE